MNIHNFDRISRGISITDFIKERVGYVIGGYENTIEDFDANSEESIDAIAALNDYQRIIDEIEYDVCEVLNTKNLSYNVKGLINTFAITMLNESAYIH